MPSIKDMTNVERQTLLWTIHTIGNNPEYCLLQTLFWFLWMQGRMLNTCSLELLPMNSTQQQAFELQRLPGIMSKQYNSALSSFHPCRSSTQERVQYLNSAVSLPLVCLLSIQKRLSSLDSWRISPLHCQNRKTNYCKQGASEWKNGGE